MTYYKELADELGDEVLSAAEEYLRTQGFYNFDLPSKLAFIQGLRIGFSTNIVSQYSETDKLVVISAMIAQAGLDLYK